ncbi:MAG: BatA domain-containing protein, partial [Gemmatimonadales bacterium]
MIGFSAPWALLGLVAAGLPLLLHLVQRHEVPERLFPAVRYLEDATREQQRRLRFRNWLLLIVRTLLIVALVLAAAGATMRRTTIGPHAASALVVVIDNSPASGVVVDGVPVLTGLLRSASQVLSHATVADRVWFIAADGVARAGTPAELRRELALLGTEPMRLDLGRAISTGRDLIAAARRPGQVVVVSALEQSALGATRGDGSLLVVRPAGDLPANRGVLTLDAGLQPWSPSGGHLTISIVSSDTTPVPVTLSVGNRVLRDVLVTPGTASVQRIGAQAPGWLALTASLPPDEFRLDDSRTIAVR